MMKTSFIVLVLSVFAANAASIKPSNTDVLVRNLVQVIEEVTILVQDPSHPLEDVVCTLIELLELDVNLSELLQEIEDYINENAEGPNIEHVKISVEIISWIGRGLISDCNINQALIEVFNLMDCDIDVNLIWIQIGSIPGIQVNKCLESTSTFCKIIGIEPVEEIPEEGELIIQLIQVIIDQLKEANLQLDVIVRIVVQLLHIDINVEVIINEVLAYCNNATQGPNVETVQSILSIIQIVIVGVVEQVPSIEVLQQIIAVLKIDIKITALISGQVDEIFAEAPNLSSCQKIPLLCVIINGGGAQDPTTNENIIKLVEEWIEVIENQAHISALIEIILSLTNSEVDPLVLQQEIDAFLSEGVIGDNDLLVSLVLDVIRVLYGISTKDLTVEEGLRKLCVLLNLDVDISGVFSVIIGLFGSVNFDISICESEDIPIICDLFYVDVDTPKPDPSQEQYITWITLLLQYIKDGDEINAIKIALTILNVTVDIDIIVSETSVAISSRRNNGPNREIVSKVIQILVWGAKAIQGSISPETLVNNIGGLIGVVLNVVGGLLDAVVSLVNGLLGLLGCLLSSSFYCTLLSLPRNL